MRLGSSRCFLLPREQRDGPGRFKTAALIADPGLRLGVAGRVLWEELKVLEELEVSL